MASSDREAKRSRLGDRKARHMYKKAKGKVLASQQYVNLCKKADSLNGHTRSGS